MLAQLIKTIVGTNGTNNFITGVNWLPKNAGINTSATASIPNANAQLINVTNINEFSLSCFTLSILPSTIRLHIRGSITVPNAVIKLIGIVIIFSAFS